MRVFQADTKQEVVNKAVKNDPGKHFHVTGLKISALYCYIYHNHHLTKITSEIKKQPVQYFTYNYMHISAYIKTTCKIRFKMDNNLRIEITQLHAQVCNGLSDPTRILILYKLAEEPINVSDLSAALEIPQPTVSRHLKVLRERHMVNAHREGKSVYYEISDHRIIQALDLLRAVLASSLEDQVALVRSETES